jgi:fructosamine-3-kinase
MAERYFDSNCRKRFLKLLDKLPELLIEPKKPSLLHGDLWSGNYIVGNDGKAWLIDPAVYVGHAEADLAMTELFGHFPSEFYNAYASINPIDSGYKDRRDLYNLYHLLNHLNLFGDTYLSAVMSILFNYT